jgi:excisionase family DNA binding protein
MGEERVLPDGRLWTVQEVSYFLGVPVSTLYHWRSEGQGPRSCRLGRHVRYRAEDVRAWVARQSGEAVA